MTVPQNILDCIEQAAKHAARHEHEYDGHRAGYLCQIDDWLKEQREQHAAPATIPSPASAASRDDEFLEAFLKEAQAQAFLDGFRACKVLAAKIVSPELAPAILDLGEPDAETTQALVYLYRESQSQGQLQGFEAARQPALLFLDTLHPSDSGAELLAAIRRMLENLPPPPPVTTP